MDGLAVQQKRFTRQITTAVSRNNMRNKDRILDLNRKVENSNKASARMEQMMKLMVQNMGINKTLSDPTTTSNRHVIKKRATVRVRKSQLLLSTGEPRLDDESIPITDTEMLLDQDLFEDMDDINISGVTEISQSSRDLLDESSNNDDEHLCL